MVPSLGAVVGRDKSCRRCPPSGRQAVVVIAWCGCLVYACTVTSARGGWNGLEPGLEGGLEHGGLTAGLVV
jgi:hypothetical protein